jgi:hypothetical protein
VWEPGRAGQTFFFVPTENRNEPTKFHPARHSACETHVNSPTAHPPTPTAAPQIGFDADCGDCPCSHFRTSSAQRGVLNMTVAECCARCDADPECTAWVSEAKATGGDTAMCYPLRRAYALKPNPGRIAGGVVSGPSTCADAGTALEGQLRITVLAAGWVGSAHGRSREVVWTPGTTPTGNLLGTALSLDGVSLFRLCPRLLDSLSARLYPLCVNKQLQKLLQPTLLLSLLQLLPHPTPQTPHGKAQGR